MWYALVRFLFWLAVLFAYILRLRKSYIKNKKRAALWAGAIILVGLTLSALAPAENLFFTFKTPQAVFRYSYFGQMTGTVEGEDSCLLLYTLPSGANTRAILPKTEKGYQIGTSLSYEQVSAKLYAHGTVSVYHAKDTQDYYVCIFGLYTGDIPDISDSRETVFQITTENPQNASSRIFVAYGYINDMKENDYLTVGDEKIMLP